MRSPWEVLGLPPGSSQAEIRAAYARLLKERRPDVDPAGFRELRQAYEMLRQDGPARGMPWVPPPPAGAAPPAKDAAPLARGRRRRSAPARPHRHRPALSQRVVRALQRAGAVRRQRVLALLLDWWRRDQPPVPRPKIAQVLIEHADELRAWLVATDVQQALARGEARFLLAMLRAHVAAADWAAVEPLLHAVVASAGSVAEPAHAGLLVEAALWSSLAAPELAARLADAAFRSRADIGAVDLYLQIGAEVKRLPMPERLRLTRVLLDLQIGPGHPEVAAAVQAVTAALKRLWLAPLLRQELLRRFPDLKLPDASPPAPRRRDRVGATVQRRGIWFWIMMFFVVGGVVRVLRLVRGETSRPRPRHQR